MPSVARRLFGVVGEGLTITKDDSADGKARGLICLASGFIVFAVSKAYTLNCGITSVSCTFSSKAAQFYQKANRPILFRNGAVKL